MGVGTSTRPLVAWNFPNEAPRTWIVTKLKEKKAPLCATSCFSANQLGETLPEPEFQAWE